MTKIAIVSLHYSPGYTAHMQAWYRLCEESGYEARLFTDERYRKGINPKEYRYCADLKELERYRPDYAIVQNTGIENIRFFRWCREEGCRILYILHEPYMGIKEILKDGAYCLKQAAACILNRQLCNRAERVIVCSGYAEENCRKYMKRICGKCTRFPLIFPDEYAEEEREREYFSLIGTYASAKGSDLFLQFMKDAAKAGYDIRFQIATRSDLTKQLADGILQELIRDGRLTVQHGRDLSVEEINEAYRRSICCWNGYRRTTQSGVLPNAFMMGTPVAATRTGSFTEFVEDGETGVFIDSEDPGSIYNGYKRSKERNREMSRACRAFFLENFYYGRQKERFKSIIEGGTKAEERQPEPQTKKESKRAR